MALKDTMLTLEQLRGFDHYKMVNFVAQTIKETFSDDISDMEVLERLYSWTCHNQSTPYYLGLLDQGGAILEENPSMDNNTFLTKLM